MFHSTRHRLLSATLLFVLLMFFGPLVTHTRQCTHSQIATEPLLVSTQRNGDVASQGRDKRNTQEESQTQYAPIRIRKVFLVNASEIPTALEPGGFLDQAISILTVALSVKPSSGPITFTPPCVNAQGQVCLENDPTCNCTNITQLQCGERVTVPDQHQGLRNVCDSSGQNCSLQGPNGPGVADADFVLYITSGEGTGRCFGEREVPRGLQEDDGHASGGVDSSHCLLDTAQRNRPVAGWVSVCPFAFPTPIVRNGAEPIFIGVANAVETFVHQLVHTLGFSRQLFPFFDTQSPVLGSEISEKFTLPAVVSPKVVQVARNHFNCPYINGVYLFNDHWERRLLQPEVMAGIFYSAHSYLSEFTLALLEDSGWYQANYSVAQRTIAGQDMPFLYGKNLGCAFFYERCGGRFNPYRCQGGAACSYDGTARGNCMSVSEYHSCDLVIPTSPCATAAVPPISAVPIGTTQQPPLILDNSGTDSDLLELPGPSSFCFSSSLELLVDQEVIPQTYQPRCYQVEPVSDGVNFGYSVAVNATNGSYATLGCTSTGQRIDVFPTANQSIFGSMFCAHHEIVQQRFSPGASEAAVFQGSFCHRTCRRCSRINNDLACLECSVPGVQPDGPVPNSCSLSTNVALVNGRLSGNDNVYSGVVQTSSIFINGVRNTYCIDAWDDRLAQITCNIVGYAVVNNAYIGQGGVFGPGVGEIFDEFVCLEQPSALANTVFNAICPTMATRQTCDHSMDASVECSGRQLLVHEMIDYPFTAANGYQVITGCRSCNGTFSSEVGDQGSVPQCSANCTGHVATPYPLRLFDLQQSISAISVSTYGGMEFPQMPPEPVDFESQLPNFNPFRVPHFAPWQELFDTTYSGAVYYKSIEKNLKTRAVFEIIDGVIADSFITPPLFGFSATYAFIATWADVTVCCTPKLARNSFQAIVASDGNFTFGIVTYPQGGQHTFDRTPDGQGLGSEATYANGQSLYPFGRLVFDTLALPTNTKSFGQVVIRLDSLQPIPIDLDLDGIVDNMDPCVGCCVNDLEGGINWPRSAQGSRVRMPCSLFNPSFSSGSVFSRTCIGNTLWSSVDLSSCTFTAGSTNPILQHRVRIVSLNVTAERVLSGYSFLLNDAGINNVTVSVLGGSTFNTSNPVTNTTLILEFLLSSFDLPKVVLFINNLMPEGRRRRQSDVPGFETLEAVGFLPSDNCTCMNDTGLVIIFTPFCSGSAQTPCQCTALGCQCVSPYVSLMSTNATNLFCALDNDGDGFADSEDNCPGQFSLDNSCPSPEALASQITCPAEVDAVWGIQWNETLAGSMAGLRCQELTGSTLVSGSVSRPCGGGGAWGMVNTSQCQSQAIQEVVTEIARLEGLQRPLSTFEQDVVEGLTLELVSATSANNTNVLFPTDLQSVTTYADSVATLFESNLVPVGGGVSPMSVLEVISNVLEPQFQDGWTSLNNMSAPNGVSQLLLNVERLVGPLTEAAVTSFQQSQIQFPNLIVDISLVDTTFLGVDGFVVRFNQLDVFDVTAGDIPVATIPRQALLALGNAQVPITTIAFSNIESLLPRRLNMNGLGFSDTQQLPGTLVLSVQVGSNPSVIDEPIPPLLSLSFPLRLQGAASPLCVSWSSSNNGWSSENLTVESFDSNTVVCVSTHNTSFAVLVDVSGQLPPSLPLSILTYIGCGISILCLLLTIIFILTMKKDIYLKVNNFVLLNLCIALMCGLIVFCAGIETATWHVAPCSVVAALLHYFFLAAFGWMLCESVLIYNLLVKVFGAHQRKWLYIYMAIGWGFPVPILIISLASRYNFYYIRGSLDAGSPHYNSIRACWLSSQEGVIFAFVIPMVAILIINTCLLIRALVSLWKSGLGSTAKKIGEEEGKEARKTAIKLFKATVILMPLLGLTWLFGLLAAIPFPQPGQLILSALFLILNTLQGAFIFFFHVVRHDKVWPRLKRICCPCLKSSQDSTSNSASRTKSTKANDSTLNGNATKRSRVGSYFTSRGSTAGPSHYSSTAEPTADVGSSVFAVPNIYDIQEEEKKVELALTNTSAPDAVSVQGFEVEFLED